MTRDVGKAGLVSDADKESSALRLHAIKTTFRPVDIRNARASAAATRTGTKRNEARHHMTNEPRSNGEPQDSSERWAKGLDAYASQFQIPRDQVAQWFTTAVGERFGQESIYSAARAWTDDELSLRDRSLIVLASLITMGGADGQLRMHTRWALDHGATREEIEAMAALLAIYAGFTRAANGLMIIREELAKIEAS